MDAEMNDGCVDRFGGASLVVHGSGIRGMRSRATGRAMLFSDKVTKTLADGMAWVGEWVLCTVCMHAV